MSDEHESHQDCGSSEALLAFIKEQSDDIESAVIPQTPQVTVTENDRPKEIYTHVGMILHMIDGSQKVIGRPDAEIVLNDGILQRMRIKISFLREAGDDDDSITVETLPG